MNKAILHIDVQSFILENLNKDIRSLSLKKSPFPSVCPAELAGQIDSRKRCQHKLPLWFRTPFIYYPPKLSVEQSSSEIAARYKAGLVEGDSVIDLTGGFGVDSHFFALKCPEVTHCELNQEISDIAAYNSKILGSKIYFHPGDGIDYLRRSGKTYSTIYIDPSRRVESKKVFMLRDCEPDVVNNLRLLREHSSLLMIKAAPLLDIQSTISELKEVSSIHVISIKNECKELLFLIRDKDAGTDPPITCALFGSEKDKTYTFRISEERTFHISSYSDPLNYIYEPDVALLKAGCFKLITRDFQVSKIQQHTHLYTSRTLNDSFPGRKFRVKSTWHYGSFLKSGGIKKANLICRNFPLSPEALKKKLGISDGGDEYLLFCTSNTNELLVLHCERVL
ncbi:MAG: THUMP-like domain-containing protein [Daejeonella sp.]